MMHLKLLVCCTLLHLVSSTYDLIDPTPRCYTLGLCTDYGEWGTYSAIHPNSEERTQATIINIARMFPSDFQTGKYGANVYGTYGGSWDYDTGDYCGEAAGIPYYWQTDANQASRFGSWDCSSTNCDSSCGHSTCSDPNRCDSLFGGDCGFGARCNSFVNQYGLSCSGEGLCGANMCFTDGHCGAMFNPDKWIFGVGFNPGDNGITLSYLYNSDDYDVSYSIPNACHFDERIKVKSDSYASDDKYLTFLLQWFDEDNSINKVYVAYQGSKIEMDLVYGDDNSAFFRLNEEIPDACEPYYFIAETTNSKSFRMPESDRYMFGTSWSEWSWWVPDGQNGRPNECLENHYYLLDDGVTWVANGGPDVGITDDSGCVGCANTYSIENYWDSDSSNDDSTDDSSPTGKPTDKPTDDPTQSQSGFACDDGCLISTNYYNDRYCDCSSCEDEPSWTCSTCGNGDGRDCDYIGEECGNYMYCNGVVVAPTDKPTDAPTVFDSAYYYCDDGCQISGSYYDDRYCDCPSCEDEPSWTCDTCINGDGLDCDYMSENCGNYMYCNGNSKVASGSSDSRTRGSSSASSTDSSSSSGDGDNMVIILVIVGVCVLLAIGIGGYLIKNRILKKRLDKDNGILENDYVPPADVAKDNEMRIDDDAYDTEDKRVY